MQRQEVWELWQQGGGRGSSATSQELRRPPDSGPEVQLQRDHTDTEGLDGSSARQQAAPCGKLLHTTRKGVIQRPLSLVKTLGMQMG